MPARKLPLLLVVWSGSLDWFSVVCFHDSPTFTDEVADEAEQDSCDHKPEDRLLEDPLGNSWLLDSGGLEPLLASADDSDTSQEDEAAVGLDDVVDRELIGC